MMKLDAMTIVPPIIVAQAVVGEPPLVVGTTKPDGQEPVRELWDVQT